MVDCTESEFSDSKSHVDLFELVSLFGVENHDCGNLLQSLKQVFTFMSFLTNKKIFRELKRVTINRTILDANKRIINISQLKYPPTKFVKKYGRANLINQSVLYAGFDRLTILNEMKPNIGDLISTSTWKLKKEEPLLFTPIFKRWQLGDGAVNLEMKLFDNEYQNLLKTYPENISKYIDLTLDFIASEFEKIVNRDYWENYIFSAFFANQILYNYLTDSGERIDAILYPSVASNRDFNNIAIKPDKFDEYYELQAVNESVVVGIPDRAGSGYMLEGICDSEFINEEKEEVVWEKQFSQPQERMDFFVKKFHIKF